MLYSAREFQFAVHDPNVNYYGLSQIRHYNGKQLATFLKNVKQAILDRDTHVSLHVEGARLDPGYSSNIPVGKFLRPWAVVPALRDFCPPAGEFGVGVEVEMGFLRPEYTREMLEKIKNWKYITIDLEGGPNGAEVTFPPMLYSKFGRDSQACRYLRLLESMSEMLNHHNEDDMVGTHVNVSTDQPVNCPRLRAVDSILRLDLSSDLCRKYFGRGTPYRYGVDRGNYIEWKLFNSQTNWKVLRRYVDVAVALTALIHSEEGINTDSVLAALEAGYNKNGKI